MHCFFSLQLPSSELSTKRSTTGHSYNERKCNYLYLNRRGPDANLLRHIQDEADGLGSTCLLVISDREVVMDMFLPIARLTLAGVSR